MERNYRKVNMITLKNKEYKQEILISATIIESTYFIIIVHLI